VCLDVLDVDYDYYGDAVFFDFFVLLWSCGGSTLSVISLVGCRVHITPLHGWVRRGASPVDIWVVSGVSTMIVQPKNICGTWKGAYLSLVSKQGISPLSWWEAAHMCAVSLW
jgi:hypothetical protein